MDLAGHRIVGWSMSDRPNAELVCQALQIGTRSLGRGWRRFAALARDGRWGAPQLLRDFSNSLAAGTQQRSLLSLNQPQVCPGDRIFARSARSTPRFLVPINTSNQDVLRRWVEFTNALLVHDDPARVTPSLVCSA